MSERELPEGWVETTLGQVVEYGKAEKATREQVGDDTWVLELEDIEKSSSRIIQRLNFSERQFKSTKNRFKKGDVLYGKLRPYLEKVVIADRDGVCTTEIIPLDARPHLDNRYLFYWLKSLDFLSYVNEVGYGVNMPRLGTKEGKAAPFVLAPQEEQKIIADKLDELLAQVNNLKARLDAIPAILKRFRESVLAAAVSGDLSNGSANVWPNVKLIDVVVAKPRNGRSPKGVDFETPYKSLTLSSTTSGKFLGEKYKFVELDIKEDSHLWVKDGDILIQRANTIEYVGVSALYRGPDNIYVYPDLMMKCAVNDRAVPEFLHFILLSRSVRKYFRDNATGTSGNMPKINQKIVSEVQFKLPEIQEQAEIVRRVDQLFAFADQIEQQVANAQTRVNKLTQSILAKAFRGELTAEWRAENPELISGEHSAAALLERIKAEKAKQTPTKTRRGGRKATVTS